MDDARNNPLVWLLVVGAAITVGAVAVFSWRTGSKAVIFAGATVVSSLIFYGLSAYASLRSSSENSSIPAQFMVHPDAPAISIELGEKSPIGAAVLQSSYWIQRTNPKAFDDPQALLEDLVVHDLTVFLFAWFVDWRAVRFTVERHPIGPLRYVPKARPSHEDSVVVTKEELQKQLIDSGNIFGGAPITGAREVLLPPETSVVIERKALSVVTPFCTVRFSPFDQVEPVVIKPAHSSLAADAGAQAGAPQPNDPNPSPGTASYPGGFDTEMPDREAWMRQWLDGKRLTYVVRVLSETKYSAMRAEHLRMNEYRNFCRDLVAQAREWFTNPRNH